MSRESRKDIMDRLVAMPVGGSEIFTYPDLHTWDIVNLAKACAAKHGFKLRSSADYGGIRVEKLKGDKNLDIEAELLSLKDEEARVIDVSASMRDHVMRKIKKLEKEHPTRVFMSTATEDGRLEIWHCSTIKPE